MTYMMQANRSYPQFAIVFWLGVGDTPASLEVLGLGKKEGFLQRFELIFSSTDRSAALSASTYLLQTFQHAISIIGDAQFCIIVHAGPGSFTQSRSFVSVANALAYVYSVPIFSFSTWDVVMHCLTTSDEKRPLKVATIHDIHARNLFAAEYSFDYKNSSYHLARLFNVSRRELMKDNTPDFIYFEPGKSYFSHEQVNQFLLYFIYKSLELKSNLSTSIVHPYYQLEARITQKRK